MNSLVAIWRLMRAVLHLGHGIFIIQTRFRRASAAERHAHIQWWSAKLLRLMGMRLVVDRVVDGDVSVDGMDMAKATASSKALLVANHVSWLDIAAIHAVLPQARFVSKADVLKWPLIGSLVAGAGTLFIERQRKRDALRVIHHMAQALEDSQVVAVFPEGTVTDGSTLLPFHANLFQAAVSTQAPIWPVALIFSDHDRPLSEAVRYTEEVNLMSSAWRIASTPWTQVRVRVLTPLVTHDQDRRALAEAAREVIASAVMAPR
jgi:1-acyl-sn-glycerol-3-phosphate acyltransferase